MTGFVLNINDRIRNRKVDFFNQFSLELKHDSVASTFGFNFYFDPDNKEHKAFACVSHYHEVYVSFNDERLITGNITNQKFKQSSIKELASIGGYSKTGVLEDCEIPPQLYPLQSNGLSLEEITRKLLKPFKLDYSIDAAVASKMSKSFDTSTASETQTVKEYLTELAKQKDIIISHDENGRLLFTEAKADSAPIVHIDLTKGILLGTSCEFEFNGQSIHSHITVQKQQGLKGGNAGSYTIRNPYVIGGYYRPRVVSQSSGDDIDTKEFAERELANELANIKLSITTDRWIVDGKIFKPNSTITVFSPELYMYKMVTWFIQSIRYTGDAEQTTATLTCVLPEVYNKKMPISIYKGINLH